MSAKEGYQDLEDAQDLANDQYLSYVGNDLPGYVVCVWVVSMIAFAWYTWVWYLPDLSLWMGWG